MQDRWCLFLWSVSAPAFTWMWLIWTTTTNLLPPGFISPQPCSSLGRGLLYWFLYVGVCHWHGVSMETRCMPPLLLLQPSDAPQMDLCHERTCRRAKTSVLVRDEMDSLCVFNRKGLQRGREQPDHSGKAVLLLCMVSHHMSFLLFLYFFSFVLDCCRRSFSDIITDRPEKEEGGESDRSQYNCCDL